MVKPNFDEVRIVGNRVLVQGISGDVQEIATIRVILAQENNIDDGLGAFVEDGDDVIRARGRVVGVDTLWQAELPLGQFKVGPAVAFGVEQRKENFLTLSWAEPVDIVK
jgi:hypothetical protein